MLILFKESVSWIWGFIFYSSLILSLKYMRFAAMLPSWGLDFNLFATNDLVWPEYSQCPGPGSVFFTIFGPVLSIAVAFIIAISDAAWAVPPMGGVDPALTNSPPVTVSSCRPVVTTTNPTPRIPRPLSDFDIKKTDSSPEADGRGWEDRTTRIAGWAGAISGGIMGGLIDYKQYWPSYQAVLDSFAHQNPALRPINTVLSKAARPSFIGLGAFMGGCTTTMAWKFGAVEWIKAGQSRTTNA